MNHRADAHGDGPGGFYEGISAPHGSRIMRDREHGRVGLAGQPRAAHVVTAAPAGSEARAFRENHDPPAVGQPAPALLERLLEGAGGGAAVDRDRAHHRESPAEEGHAQQLALEDPDLWRKNDLIGQRFPCRLMLGQDDARVAGKVFAPDHAIAHPANYRGHSNDQMRPSRDNAIAGNRSEGEGEQRDDGEDERDREPEHLINDRTQERDGQTHATMWRTAAARSAKTGVPSGSPPAALVLAPLPVSTSIGCAPAAAAACRSRSESPTLGTPATSTLNRWAMSMT